MLYLFASIVEVTGRAEKVRAELSFPSCSSFHLLLFVFWHMDKFLLKFTTTVPGFSVRSCLSLDPIPLCFIMSSFCASYLTVSFATVSTVSDWTTFSLSFCAVLWCRGLLWKDKVYVAMCHMHFPYFFSCLPASADTGRCNIKGKLCTISTSSSTSLIVPWALSSNDGKGRKKYAESRVISSLRRLLVSPQPKSPAVYLVHALTKKVSFLSR